jgi:hypothetical protein
MTKETILNDIEKQLENLLDSIKKYKEYDNVAS